MGILDHLTCLLQNLYAVQEATVRTRHGTMDLFQIGSGVHQGCILSPCLFNLYAEYTMRNAGLEETQAGIRIAGRNINNLRYTDWIKIRQRNQGSNCQCCSIIEKAREFQENIYFCFIDYSKAFDFVDHNKLWKIF